MARPKQLGYRQSRRTCRKTARLGDPNARVRDRADGLVVGMVTVHVRNTLTTKRRSGRSRCSSSTKPFDRAARGARSSERRRSGLGRAAPGESPSRRGSTAAARTRSTKKSDTLTRDGGTGRTSRRRLPSNGETVNSKTLIARRGSAGVAALVYRAARARHHVAKGPAPPAYRSTRSLRYRPFAYRTIAGADTSRRPTSR
jgi:hypothetical protein